MDHNLNAMEVFTADKTEDQHTWGRGLHYPEPPGTNIPLDYGVSAAHKVFLKHDGEIYVNALFCLLWHAFSLIRMAAS